VGVLTELGLEVGEEALGGDCHLGYLDGLQPDSPAF